MKGKDSEGVHQLRVSLRKMRSALSIFSPVIDAPYRKQWRKELKKLSKQLDAARDLDVFIMTYFHSNYPDSELHKVLNKQKTRIYKQLAKRLRGEFKQRWRQLKKELKQSHWSQQHCRQQNLSLSSLAHKQLNRLYQEVQQKAQSLDLTDEAALHQLRISFKQLRYACEFLEPVLDSSRSPVFINMMKALQDQLGDIHDAAVQREMLAVLPLSTHNELQEIVKDSQRNGQRLKRTLTEQLKRFNTIPVPWQVNLVSESV